MCGICGFTGEVVSRDDVIERMTKVITHRGPDSNGFYKEPDNKITMGFRRLSIIDLDAGHQPIYNEDKSMVLTFNGEIYNYQELRKELIELGHRVTDIDFFAKVEGKYQLLFNSKVIGYKLCQHFDTVKTDKIKISCKYYLMV